MMKKLLATGLTLSACTLAGYWLLTNDASEPAIMPADASSTSSVAPSAQFDQANLSAPVQISANGLPEPQQLENSEQLSAQVEDAMLQYEELSKYPPHSQPILSEQHVHSFVNLGVPEASHPFPFDDLETPIQLSIELKQFNYFYGDTIQAQVKVMNAPQPAQISYRAVLIDLTGEVLAETSHAEIKDMQADFTVDTKAYSAQEWPQEMNFGAHVDVNGYAMFISAPFRINTETAELDSIGFSEPVAENLVIPVNLNVKLPGYYFLAGILYSQTTQQPLIHLETEGRLGEGLSTLSLKAHIQALKKGGDEGPYYLDKIRIERWSDEQIPRDVAGKVPPADYTIEGYAFGDYQDVPYLDPLAEERKRLLQGLSSR